HSLVPVLLEGGRADKHGYTAAVLPEVLLLEGLQGPALRELWDQPLVAVAPFWRSQVRPAHAAGGEILAVVSHHGEECIIRLENPPLELRNEYADDVGVDQASDPRFAFRELAIEPRILDRDGRFGSEQLEQRHPRGREDTSRQAVFEVENADHSRLLEQRH